jgi:DNA replication and repair protein RecF
MRLTRLELTQFRSYQNADIGLSEGINIFSGLNTAGKTNILEAVYLGATGGSFRTTTDADMIRWETDFFRIKLTAEADGDVSEVVVAMKQGERKQIRLNDKAVNRSKLIGTIPVVLFLPQDLSLIFDSPGSRRRYLDRVLSQLDAQYLSNWQSLQRILKQRNTLLARIRVGEARPEQLDVWDAQLVEVSTFIIGARREIIAQMAQDLPAEYARLGEGESFKLVYLPNTPAEQLPERLVQARPDDIRIAQTTAGPHRDDFMMEMNGRDVRSFASRGEVRSMLLSLKFVEVALYSARHDQRPLLLLDDVSSELDERRRKSLMGLVRNHQSLITTTDFRQLEMASGGYTVYAVRPGIVETEESNVE